MSDSTKSNGAFNKVLIAVTCALLGAIGSGMTIVSQVHVDSVRIDQVRDQQKVDRESFDKRVEIMAGLVEKIIDGQNQQLQLDRELIALIKLQNGINQK